MVLQSSKIISRIEEYVWPNYPEYFGITSFGSAGVHRSPSAPNATFYTAPFTPGCWVNIEDRDTGEIYRFGLSKIRKFASRATQTRLLEKYSNKRSIVAIAIRKLNNIEPGTDNDDFDAEEAYCILQFVLFGDVIYG